MFVNLDKYINTLTEFQISANQFLLCYLLFVDERQSNGEFKKKGRGIAYLYKYATKAQPWTSTEVEDLVKKNLVINNKPNAEKKYPDHLELTDRFKEFVLVTDSNFKQLWDKFPSYIDNFKDKNGPRIKLKMCDREVLKKVYKRKVKSQAKHEHIMELLDWALEHDEINFNFENFVRGEVWDTLEELREDGGTNSNMTAAK